MNADDRPTLCILLWARPGLADEASAYEDKVLPLLTEHGGKVLQRMRTREGDPGIPVEIQTIRFADQAGFDGYLADPRRTQLAAERDRVIERTELMRVELVD